MNNNNILESDEHLKQVMFKCRNEIEDSFEEMREASKRLFRKGRLVTVHRGNGTWNGEIVHASLRLGDYSVGVRHLRSQKIHNIHIDNLKLWKQDGDS